MRTEGPSWLASLAAGAAGAVAITIIHESARGVVPHAPRMDKIGRRALARGMRAVGYEPPGPPRLHAMALAGDIISNSIYYMLVARGESHSRWTRALLMGTAAGIGAIVLPPYMGLGEPPGRHRLSTQAMTTALYLSGALIAAAAAGLAPASSATREAAA